MSNQNKKVINMTSSVPLEQQSELVQQEWLKGSPTREEVTNFVSGYVNNEVLPVIMNAVGKDLFQLKCRNEVLLKVLIDKEVCTAEEFEAEYKQYLKEQTEEAMKRQEQLRREQELKASGIIVPDKTIIH